jgi:sugar/nucleoside kinase (ribokinase family)
MHTLVALEGVDYLVLGHLSLDMTSAGPRLGGAAAYSALTARALGLRVGVVTAAADQTPLERLSGIPVVAIPSDDTTVFENIYDPNGRTQVLHARAADISYDSVPEAWRRASILHLAPLAGELEAELPAYFSGSLLAVTPQGWMRSWDATGRVSASPWAGAAEFLPRAGAVVISREDVNADEEAIESMAHQTRVLAVTEGAAGAVLYWHGDRRRFRPPEVQEVDATGAGDVFAAAFFVRLFTTRDPWEAARFATQLAARSVTRPGLDGIPTQAEIAECLLEVF